MRKQLFLPKCRKILSVAKLFSFFFIKFVVHFISIHLIELCKEKAKMLDIHTSLKLSRRFLIRQEKLSNRSSYLSCCNVGVSPNRSFLVYGAFYIYGTTNVMKSTLVLYESGLMEVHIESFSTGSNTIIGVNVSSTSGNGPPGWSPRNSAALTTVLDYPSMYWCYIAIQWRNFFHFNFTSKSLANL